MIKPLIIIPTRHRTQQQIRIQIERTTTKFQSQRLGRNCYQNPLLLQKLTLNVSVHLQTNTPHQDGSILSNSMHLVLKNI